MKRPKVTLIYIDSGGGHRAAASALRDVITEQERPWDLTLVSIQELLDSIDFIRKSTGIRFQEVYNIMLRRGWTRNTAQLIPVMHGLIRATHGAQVHVLENYWRATQPDLVVSLIPHYNRSLREALEKACGGVPYVTLLTDIADYPPHFWIEDMDQWVICGSSRAAEQARRIGLPEERVLRASGMILNPRFYRTPPIDRAAERRRRGLNPDLPTGLVLFGGEGSTDVARVTKALNRENSGIQLIVVCGKNQQLEAELRSREQHVPMFIEGFTREVPLLMEIADFFIGKPVPGSLSEALLKRLPIIVQRNAWTMAHELYNTEWLEEIGAGMVVENFSRDLPAAVQHLLERENYARYRSAAERTRNQAVFEIPGMLSAILADASRSQPDPATGFSARSRLDRLRSA